MNLEIIHVGLLGTNCYVTWDDNKNCVVVDCGGDAQKVADFINERGFTPTHLLLTHGHGDHMGGAADLKDLFPQIQIVLGEKDLEMIGDGEKSMSNAVAPYARPFVPDILVKEGDKIVSGSMTFTVMETPGHTRGGVTYIKNNELYCGDTLFQGSMGRTDLEGGDDRKMEQSLRKFAKLPIPRGTQLLPGHGDFSTMGQELDNNFYIRQALRNAKAE